MKIIVFGLSISSAWGNGHATLLRGLFRALSRDGHEVHFFERDVPYYAAHRDASSFAYVHLHLYSEWNEVLPSARALLADADVGIVTSYCPDGSAACSLLLDAKAGKRAIFYDMDTPVTLSRLERGEPVPYLPAAGLSRFDLVLSYTGGLALNQLKSRLGASRTATLYGWVDEATHSRVPPKPEFTADLSYLGTYAADRQSALEELLFEPARRLPQQKFVIGGAMYPDTNTWPPNVKLFPHVSPPEHSAFYSSSPLTLSVTRGTMAAMGYCPSGRLFEAAACGTAVLSDWWEGLDTFFAIGEEILVASSAAESLSILNEGPEYARQIGRRARQRALECHTAQIRARRLIHLIEDPKDDNEVSADAPRELAGCIENTLQGRS